jgi:hypothetical protein
MSTLRTGLARAVTIGILLTGAAAAPAAGQTTRTWQGGADDPWSDGANWNPAGAPVDGDSLIFVGGGTTTSINDLINVSIDTISFTSNYHTVYGNGFTLASGFTASTGRLDIVPLITFGGDQTWNTGSGFVSPYDIALNGRTWTIEGGTEIVLGAIGGTGAIVVNDGGVHVSFDCTFLGPVTINNGGAFFIATAQGLGVGDGTAANGTTVNPGGRLYVNATAPLTLGMEALTVSGTAALVVPMFHPVTFTGPIELAGTTEVYAGSGAGRNLTFNGPVKAPGNLVIMGDAIVTLASTGNTLTGVGFTGAGTLRVGAPNALATARVNVPAGATLDINDSGTDVLGLDGNGTVTLGATAGSLTIKNTLPSTFTGIISGPGGLLIKDGPSMLTLGGANTFGHGPRIDAGVLRVTHPNALGAGDGTQNTGTLVLDDATLALDNVSLGNERIHLGGNAQPGILQVRGTNPSSIAGPVVMTQQAAITGTDGATLTFNGELTIVTPVSITNARAVVMNPASSVQGPVTVEADATLAAGAAGVFHLSTEVVLNGGTFELNGFSTTVGSLSGNGVLAFGTNGALTTANTAAVIFAGTSTGTGTLTKTGGGALTLASALVVTGDVTVSSGTLILAHPQALATTPKVTISFGAGLFYTVPAAPAYQLEILGAGPAGDGAVHVFGGDVTFNGPIGTSGGFDSTIRVSAPHTLTFMGPVTAPVLSIVGSGAAVFGSTGHALSALYIGATPVTNTVTGPTTVRFAAANALGGPFQLKVHTGSTFDLNGFDLTVTSVTGAGTVAIGSRTLTIQNGAQFDGIFTGAGAIDASGQSLSVTGTSTFTGSVTAASFANSGTLPASVHATGDTLRLLPNSVTGALTMGAGVFLIVGDDETAAGVTTGNLNLPAGAIMSAYLHTTTMTVHGTVTLAGELTPFLHPDVSTPGQVLTLIDNDGTDPVVGMFGNYGEGGIVQVDEASYRINYSGGTGNDVTLTKQTAIYFLSEGATGAFFDTELLIANPHPEIADVEVLFYREDGELEGFLYHIPARSRLTILVDDLPEMESATFSTTVRSINPALDLIVERTMRWDATGYGAHTEKATTGPALTWYFAEGSEGSFFRTYLLLANTDWQANTATVTYLRENEPSITRTYDLEPNTRRTIQAADEPELMDRSFGMTVTFARRGIAERAMYFGTSPIWKGGHESLGETAPSTTWFLAEGATGAGFDTFILVANPNAEPTDVTYTFLSESANPATVTKTIPGLSRLTVNIEAEGLAIPDGPVATQVTATRPVIAERAQYWPQSFDQWTETHNSFGVTAPGLKWGLAEGRAGGPEGYQTYILLANAGTEDAHVQLQFLGDGGSVTPPPVTIDVPAQRRVNVPVAPTGNAGDPATNFGAVITSDKPIVVERALYWNVNGEVWAAGTNATATRLP